MRIRSLKHVIEAIRALVQPEAITVMGSSSLLARDKDMELLRGLVRHGVLDLSALRLRYQNALMDEVRMFRAGRALQSLPATADIPGDACPGPSMG